MRDIANEILGKMRNGDFCPECGPQNMGGLEYAYGSPERYDGVSEWVCPKCRLRIGRWSGRVLTGDMVEPRWGRMA